MPTSTVPKTPVVPTIKIEGTELDVPKAHVTYLRASSSLSEAGRATFHLATGDLAPLAGSTLVVGKSIEIFLPKGPSTVKSVFKGDITTVGFRSLGAQQSNTIIVEARESSHRLTSASEFKAYNDQKRSDVAKAIAGRHGLGTGEIASDDPTAAYLLQHGTDFDYLGEIAAEIGYEWFVAEDKLYFRKQGTAECATLKASDDTLLSVSVRYTGTPVASAVKVHTWDPAAQSVVTGSAGNIASPADLLNSSATLVTDNYSKAKTEFGKDLSVGALRVADQSEAEARAGALAREMFGSGLELEGETYGNPDIKAGTFLKLENLGTAADGKYYLTEVVHEFTSADTRTLFYSSGHRPERPAGRRSSTELWSHALVIGKVTNVKDEENLGRVKVKYPTLDSPEGESHWARVLSVDAGAERGMLFLPEIDDEVLVGFENNDVRYPVVLGGLWSGGNALPDATVQDNGAVKKRLYKSKGGHQVIFFEDSGATDTFGITVQTNTGKSKVVLTDEKITIEADAGKEMVLKAGGSEITFGSNGALSIKCSTLKIDAQQTVEAKSGTAMTLKGGTDLKLEATVNLEAKGAMGKLESSGPLTVKGAIVQIN